MHVFLCNTPYNLVSALSIASAFNLQDILVIDNGITSNEQRFERLNINYRYIGHIQYQNNSSSSKSSFLKLCKYYEIHLLSVLQNLDSISFYIYQDADPASRAIVNAFNCKPGIKWLAVEEGNGHLQTREEVLKAIGCNGLSGVIKHIIGDIFDRVYFGGYYRSRFKRNCEKRLFSQYIVHRETPPAFNCSFLHVGLYDAAISNIFDVDIEHLNAANIFIGSPLKEEKILSDAAEQKLIQEIFSIFSLEGDFYIKPHPREDASKYVGLVDGKFILNQYFPTQIFSAKRVKFSTVAYIMTSYLPPADKLICFASHLKSYNLEYFESIRRFIAHDE